MESQQLSRKGCAELAKRFRVTVCVHCIFMIGFPSARKSPTILMYLPSSLGTMSMEEAQGPNARSRTP